MKPADTSPEREHRAGALFLAAAELSPVERERFLTEVEASDPELRVKVEALLDADRKNSDGFLRAPAGGFPLAAPPEEPAPEAPTAIGPYRIVRELGRGEHAIVYLARQEHPVEREVAIKVLHLSRGSQQILQRFETERRILALMDHANITRLYEAGATPDGHAYFVMEYVRGGPIAHYCKDRALPLRRRLELICDVCRAVEHAHQRGIIHRDLKPTNILIAESAGHGAMVKVIDFGVARASGAGLYSFPSCTQHGQLIGTIAYMSPEQIGGDGLLVDTRSDVYALGAVLYEVICDTPAFDATDAGAATLISRITLQGPPPPRSVRRTIPHDVEAVIMRALERDPARRYQTVAALRNDIERRLAGRAVESLGARRLYVARRFIARHRAAFAVLLILLAMLAAAAVHTTIAQTQKFNLAVELAQAGFNHTKAMAKTAGERGRRRPLLVVLEDQSAALLRDAPSHTGVLHLRADVLGAKGDLELEDGRPESALALFEETLAIRARLAELDRHDFHFRIDQSIATVRVGDAARALGHDDDAERMYLRAMVMDERLYSERPGMPRVVTLLAWSCDRLASYATVHKDQDRADALYARCLQLMQRLCTLENSADAHRGLCTAYMHTADALRRRGDAAGYRERLAKALGEATTAVSLSPNDRLARWAVLSARSAYLESRRDLLPPADAEAEALETLAQARELANLDTSDFTMHSVLNRAMILASECAESAGNVVGAVAIRDEQITVCRRVHELHPTNSEASRALEDAQDARRALLERHQVTSSR